MNKRIVIIVSLVGVVFLFAGYNLYSYFREQAAIAALEEQLAQERRLERERKAAERIAAEKAEIERIAAERKAIEERRAQQRAAAEAERQQKRLEAEAKAKLEREAREKEKQEREAARLQKRIEKARSISQIEDFSPEMLTTIRTLSPRYLEAHPEEALEVIAVGENTRVLPTQWGKRTLVVDQTTALMVFASISQNPNIIDTTIALGADVNAQNKMGYTALMFAAAYNSPEMVQHLLDVGADPLTASFNQDLDALHLAAAMNPNPDVVEVLVRAGVPIEGKTLTGLTPLLLASEGNRNLEVPARLADLGADTGVFDPVGKTPLGLVQGRLEGDGKDYATISDEMDERILQQLIH